MNVEITEREPRSETVSCAFFGTSSKKRTQRLHRMQRSSSRTMTSPSDLRFCCLRRGSWLRPCAWPSWYVKSWRSHSPALSQIGQSSGWFLSRNSRHSRRAWCALSLSVLTIMPSATGVLQATTTRGGSSPCFTSTWQIRHEPTGVRPG